ncbi:hypothetical protein WMW72_15935 [Paenibacillus filicis]|uniref:DUF3679 domain-containing protein n=1 Tax=Paenibacillus filicis TaxID=669464 RepID=A0ABU9DKL3_9BACL
MPGGKGWVRLGVVALGMAFCLFLGVSLATQGTERIHGPLAPGTSGAASDAARALGAEPAGAKASAAARPQETAGKDAKQSVKAAPPKRPEDPATETGINRVGNKAGELLQIMAYHSIRAVVSLFEKLLK